MSYKRFSMDFKNMLIKLFVKKLTSESDSRDEQEFENQVVENPRVLEEYRVVQKIWNEAGKTGIFRHIDTESDWRQVRSKIGHTVYTRYRRISWTGYFLHDCQFRVEGLDRSEGDTGSQRCRENTQ